MTTPRIQLRVRNSQSRPLTIDITDRPTEFQSTSPVLVPDQLPPLSTLVTYLDEGETLVLSETGIGIEKGEANG